MAENSLLFQKLSDRRQRVWSEYCHRLDGYNPSTATAEQRSAFDRLDSELTELDRRLRDLSAAASRESMAAGARSSELVGSRGGDMIGQSTFELELRDRGSRAWEFSTTRACLLHDASDALVMDVPSPMRPSVPAFEAIEARVMAAICERFGVPLPFPREVVRLDRQARNREVVQYLPHAREICGRTPPLPLACEGWTPTRARREFLAEARKLGLR